MLWTCLKFNKIEILRVSLTELRQPPHVRIIYISLETKSSKTGWEMNAVMYTGGAIGEICNVSLSLSDIQLTPFIAIKIFFPSWLWAFAAVSMMSLSCIFMHLCLSKASPAKSQSGKVIRSHVAIWNQFWWTLKTHLSSFKVYIGELTERQSKKNS